MTLRPPLHIWQVLAIILNYHFLTLISGFLTPVHLYIFALIGRHLSLQSSVTLPSNTRIKVNFVSTVRLLDSLLLQHVLFVPEF